MKKIDIDLRGHNSGQFKTHCPLCHESRKNQADTSLAVNLDDGIYFCHHCGETGKFEDHVGISAYLTKSKKTYTKPDPVLVKAERPSPEVLEYFQKRGISEATLVKGKVSYGPSFPVIDYEAPLNAKGQHPIKRDADGIPIILRGIQFPYFEEDELVCYKYFLPADWSEDGKKKYRATKNGKMVPFGLNNADERIVIVEGEIDALSLIEAGINEVWSVPNGYLACDWLDFPSVVTKIHAARQVFFAGDQDSAGLQMREELIRRIENLVGKERLYVTNWPEGCKDANEVLIKHGPARLKEIVESESMAVPIDGISEIDEFYGEYMDYYVNGLPKGESTGIPTLDDIYRVLPGNVTVITGVANYGKSEVMDEIVRCMNRDLGWKFAFYTPENPGGLHMMKLAEKYIGKPFDKEHYSGNGMSQDEVIQAAMWMQDNIFYINPRGTTFSVTEILDRAKVLIYRKGIRGLIIDPWNYVRKDFGNLREDQFINQELQKIGVFARDKNIHIWLIVHPRTLQKDKNGKMEVPTMHQLSGGSKFSDNADFAFAVHRDPKEAYETGIHNVTIHVQKARHKYVAQQGQVTLEWDKNCGRFYGKEDAIVKPIDTSETDIEYTFEEKEDDAF